MTFLKGSAAELLVIIISSAAFYDRQSTNILLRYRLYKWLGYDDEFTSWDFYVLGLPVPCGFLSRVFCFSVHRCLLAHLLSSLSLCASACSSSTICSIASDRATRSRASACSQSTIESCAAQRLSEYGGSSASAGYGRFASASSRRTCRSHRSSWAANGSCSSSISVSMLDRTFRLRPLWRITRDKKAEIGLRMRRKGIFSAEQESMGTCRVPLSCDCGRGRTLVSYAGGL